jgi:hypothetical protein
MRNKLPEIKNEICQVLELFDANLSELCPMIKGYSYKVMKDNMLKGWIESQIELGTCLYNEKRVRL